MMHAARVLQLTGRALAFWLVALPAAGQTGSVPPGWVGLYNLDMLEWLENEGRLDTLCPDTGTGGAAGYLACRAAKLGPRVWVLPLHAGPADSARIVGTLAVVAQPGRPLTLHHAAPAGLTEPVPLDVFDPDWGYGPHFHLTVVERRGDWVRLPRLPMADTYWANPLRDLGWLELRPLETDVVYVDPDDREVVLTAVGTDHVILRARQPHDFWCSAGEPPRPEPVRPRRVPLAELHDAHGRLRLRPAYTRGC